MNLRRWGHTGLPLPPGYGPPNVAAYTRNVRSTVAQGSRSGSLTAYPTTASRMAFLGRPQVGTAAIDHRFRWVTLGLAGSVAGFGVEITGAGNWYGWTAYNGWSRTTEVATVPTGVAVAAAADNAPFGRIVVAAGSGPRAVTVYVGTSGDDDGWELLDSQTLDVAATGLVCIPVGTLRARCSFLAEDYR